MDRMASPAIRASNVWPNAQAGTYQHVNRSLYDKDCFSVDNPAFFF